MQNAKIVTTQCKSLILWAESVKILSLVNVNCNAITNYKVLTSL